MHVSSVKENPTSKLDDSHQVRRHRRRSRRRGLVAHLSTLCIRVILTPLVIVPPGIALFCARRFGDLIWWLLPQRRRIADRNLRTAFGDRFSRRERAKIGRRSVENFAMTIIEGVLLPGWIRSGKLAHLVSEGPGVSRVLPIHLRGEPIIFFAGHIGAWEVGVRHLVRRGWRIGVPYRSTKNEVLQDWIVRNRAIAGPEQFHRKGALRALVRLLREGAAVTMFLDQNERHGEFVDFFGVPAATVSTVGLLAERIGAPVYMQIVRRIQPGSKYRIEFEGPLSIDSGGSHEERIRSWTQAATRRIEEKIREKPEDWLWIHDRWRTRPAGEEGSADPPKFGQSSEGR